MKLKKVIAASLAVFILFAFTGCKTSSGSATTESSKQEDTSTTDSSSSGDLNEKLNDLYQQENQIFADHKDVWDKAFGFMSKNIDDDTKNENYADFLANIIESNKDSFSEEEYATLSKDIETIRGIEEEIAKLEKEIAAADPSGSSSSGIDDSTGVFHGFKGKDLDGNDVDESLFTKNKVTVVNFWFSGCKPCVEELSKLNELNDKIPETFLMSCGFGLPNSYVYSMAPMSYVLFQTHRVCSRKLLESMTSLPAKEFNLSDRGSIEIGKTADFLVLQVTTIEHYFQTLGRPLIHRMIKNGIQFYPEWMVC